MVAIRSHPFHLYIGDGHQASAYIQFGVWLSVNIVKHDVCRSARVASTYL